MPTPELSDTLTTGIRVRAAAFYLTEQSEPDEDKYVFGYEVTITNEGDEPAQLVTRRWAIIDAAGRRDDVNGPGVIGQTPRLEAGQSFKYQSFCVLKTPWGTMEGAYQMKRDTGETLEAHIGRFYLVAPVAVAAGK